MARDGRKALIVVGVGGAMVGLVLALTRKAEAGPPIPPANIVLSNLTIEPGAVYVGNPVSIGVLVTNIGGTAGSYEIICEVI